MEFMELLVPVIAAAVYALAFYVKKYQESGESFDGIKFVSTLVLGLIIGVASAYAGIGVTSETVMAQLAAYAGLTAVVESVLKIIWRAISGSGGVE